MLNLAPDGLHLRQCNPHLILRSRRLLERKDALERLFSFFLFSCRLFLTVLCCRSWRDCASGGCNPWSALPSNRRAPAQASNDHFPDALSHIAFVDRDIQFWNVGKRCSINVESEEVYANDCDEGDGQTDDDDKDMEALSVVVGLADSIGWRNAEEEQEDQR